MGEKKLALITGGSRGIGRAVCVRLAKAGYDIAFTYSRGAEAAQETLKLCDAEGATARAYQADVTDSAACTALVKQVAEEFGHIDVLVNNAGVTRDGLIMRMSDEDFDVVMNTNARGAFYMMREVSRLMMRARSGHIVNISSVVGVMGNVGQANYAASKAGIIGLTKSTAKELAARGVTCNAIAPGFVETDMTAALSEDLQKQMLETIPLKRYGQVDDIAQAAVFLAKNTYITGQVLHVDGGMCM